MGRVNDQKYSLLISPDKAKDRKLTHTNTNSAVCKAEKTTNTPEYS